MPIADKALTDLLRKAKDQLEWSLQGVILRHTEKCMAPPQSHHWSEAKRAAYLERTVDPDLYDTIKEIKAKIAELSGEEPPEPDTDYDFSN